MTRASTNQRVYSDTHAVRNLMYAQSKCYPTLAGPIVLPAHANPNVLGAITQIVPASTITSNFHIHSIVVEATTTNGLHEIVLYYGDTDIECGRVRYQRGGAASQSAQIIIHTGTSGTVYEPLPANSRIRGAMAHSAAAGASAETISISVGYHIVANV